MKISCTSGDLVSFEGDVIWVQLNEGDTQLQERYQPLDKALDGVITTALTQGPGFKGKLSETLVLPTYGKIKAHYVLLVGVGKQETFTQSKTRTAQLRRASASALRACVKLKARSVATLLLGGDTSTSLSKDARGFTEGCELGAYKFTKHKKKAKSSEKDSDASPETVLETVVILEGDDSKRKEIQTGLDWGAVISSQVNLARDWVFDSSNYITPTFLMEQAKNIPGLECKILDANQCKALGMDTFLSVAKGSIEPPYLIHLTYRPKGTPKKRVTLVGKGITFDSGGLSLKPSGGMELMKMDMGGAAAVLATMGAIAKLQTLDIQVDGIIATCENMPNGNASKPGDIVTSMNGKTIEINNTDAEGRLILADALTYAQRQVKDTEKPDEIIDLATLTGACIVALGKTAAGIMGTSCEMIESLQRAGEQAGEKFWPLPLYDEYLDALKSDVADLINAGSKGEAGSSVAGMFLKEFIEDERAWVHLDIAGPAYTSKDQPEVPKGATGFGVRTLLYYLYQL
jgi:leucyl aminopeptidase